MKVAFAVSINFDCWLHIFVGEKRCESKNCTTYVYAVCVYIIIFHKTQV